MSILIKGMKMPTSCSSCPLSVLSENRLFCERTSNEVLRAKIDRDCPLVPVPPHYDLIDHNALKIAVMDCDCETRVDFLKHTMDCINKAPIVIPSDMPTCVAEEGE